MACPHGLRLGCSECDQLTLSGFCPDSEATLPAMPRLTEVRSPGRPALQLDDAIYLRLVEHEPMIEEVCRDADRRIRHGLDYGDQLDELYDLVEQAVVDLGLLKTTVAEGSFLVYEVDPIQKALADEAQTFLGLPGYEVELKEGHVFEDAVALVYEVRSPHQLQVRFAVHSKANGPTRREWSGILKVESR